MINKSTINNKKFTLSDISAYKKSKKLSNEIWEEIGSWKFFAQKTVGDQLIRSIDSVSANIAEGFGRYHKKDKVKFYYNSRGSVYEVAHWLSVAYERNLISEGNQQKWLMELRMLPKEINTLIKLTMINLKK